MNCCDTCLYYQYDEEEEYYVCEINLDEDEMYKFITGSMQECPYYRNNNEYEVVKHQM